MDIEEAFRWIDREDERRRARAIAGRVVAHLELRRRRRRAVAFVAAGSAVATVLALGWTHHETAAPPSPEPVVIAVAPQSTAPPVLPPVRVAPRKSAAASPAQSAQRFWEGCRASEDLAAYLGAALPGLDAAALARVEVDLRSRIGARSRGAAAGEWDDFAGALGRSGAGAAWPLLAALFDAAGPRLAIIEAAGELGDARAVPRLRPLLALADRRAMAAAGALGRIPGQESLLALVAAFESTRATAQMVASLRRELGAALERREGDLIDALRPGMHLGALCRALGELGSPAATGALVQALDEPALRDAARAALKAIARQDLGPDRDAWERWRGAHLEEWTL